MGLDSILLNLNPTPNPFKSLQIFLGSLFGGGMKTSLSFKKTYCFYFTSLNPQRFCCADRGVELLSHALLLLCDFNPQLILPFVVWEMVFAPTQWKINSTLSFSKYLLNKT